MRISIIFLYFLLSGCKDVSINESKIIATQKDYSQFHKEAFDYCKINNMNDSFYFLLDFSLHSGKNRFFVYDFNSNEITNKKLVTHGSCDQFDENFDKWEKVKFDNRVDSHCSMTGKYKIGNRDVSSWGIKIKYWLHGLESSNKTAIKRVVVLHSWNAVKDEEIFPKYSPLSWGCPAVSNEFMKVLDDKLKDQTKPVLLWIVD